MFWQSLGYNAYLTKDCGAGIGRVTKQLLSKYFDKTDLIEPCPTLMKKAKDELKSNAKVGTFYDNGMQDIKLVHSYDVIWIQWSTSYLTDNDFIAFLTKCRSNLTPIVNIIS